MNNDANIIKRNNPKFLLPTRPELFIGRENALIWIKENLYPTKHLTITGTGGLGKTAVVNEALHQLFEEGELQKRFPAGVIFHTFYHKPSLTDAYQTILEAVGQKAPLSFEDMERSVRSVLQSQPLILILDGAEEALDLFTLLKARGQAGVIVSSRKRNDAGLLHYPLEQLSLNEAVNIIKAYGGEYTNSLSSVEKLCLLVDNLPLAVRLIGRYLQADRETVEEYLHWFEKAWKENLHRGASKEDSVPLLLARSVGQVSEESQELFYIFCYLANVPLPMSALAATLQISETQVRFRVKELVNYSLWEQNSGQVLPIHTLVYQWAKSNSSFNFLHITRLMEYCEKEIKQTKTIDILHDWISHMEQLSLLFFNEGFVAQKANLLARFLCYFGELNLKINHYIQAQEKLQQALLLYQQIGEKNQEGQCLKLLGDVNLRIS